MTDHPVDNNNNNREEPAYNTRSHLRSVVIPSKFVDATTQIQSIESDTTSQNGSDKNCINSTTYQNPIRRYQHHHIPWQPSTLKWIHSLKTSFHASLTNDTGKSLLEA